MSCRNCHCHCRCGRKSKPHPLIPTKKDWDGLKSLVIPERGDGRPFYQRVTDRAFYGKK